MKSEVLWVFIKKMLVGVQIMYVFLGKYSKPCDSWFTLYMDILHICDDLNQQASRDVFHSSHNQSWCNAFYINRNM